MEYATRATSPTLEERIVQYLATVDSATRSQLCEVLGVSRTALGRALATLDADHAISAFESPHSNRGWTPRQLPAPVQWHRPQRGSEYRPNVQCRRYYGSFGDDPHLCRRRHPALLVVAYSPHPAL